MLIPLEYQISDNRDVKILKKQTFSGYKKSNVFQILEKCMVENKLDEANHWCIEIILSGYIDELWEKLFCFICKHINIANIGIISYIKKRYDIYSSLLELNNIANNLQLRNNQQFRHLMCEIICILCSSRKIRLPSITKIKKQELRLEHIRDKLQAKTIVNGSIVKINDPEEFKMISNEFCFSLQKKEFRLCMFWLSWMMEWEKLHIKKLKECKCAYRPQKNVESKFCYDFIWLVWEILLNEATRIKSSFYEEIVCLYQLFCNQFKKSKKHKRLIYVVCVIKLLFFGGYKEQHIIANYDIIITCCSHINLLYKEKKQYENASEELEKQIKFHSLQRNDYLNINVENNYENKLPTPIHNRTSKKKRIKNKTKDNKKPKNISDESYHKLNLVMNQVIRNNHCQDYSPTYHFDYTSNNDDNDNHIKNINICSKIKK